LHLLVHRLPRRFHHVRRLEIHRQLVPELINIEPLLLDLCLLPLQELPTLEGQRSLERAPVRRKLHLPLGLPDLGIQSLDLLLEASPRWSRRFVPDSALALPEQPPP
jgi:hypothetical protein